MVQLPLVQQTISFDDMPNEMRMMIINQMDPESRNAISQLSSGCYADVLNSPFFIDNITLLNSWRRREIMICIGHRQGKHTLAFQKTIPWHSKETPLILLISLGEVFPRFDSEKARRSDRKVISTKPVQSVLDVYEYAIIYFKNIMITYGRNIRCLGILGAHFDWDWTEIRPFRRLEELVSIDQATVIKLLHKIRMPLKKLEVHTLGNNGDDLSDQLAGFEQIYSVLQKLTLLKAFLNDDQLCRIRAKYINFPVGHITPYGVIQFIRDWIEGRRNDYLGLCLNYTMSDGFNHFIIFRAFGNDYIRENHPPFRIRQRAPNRGIATISAIRQGNDVTFEFNALQ